MFTLRLVTMLLRTKFAYLVFLALVAGAAAQMPIPTTGPSATAQSPQQKTNTQPGGQSPGVQSPGVQSSDTVQLPAPAQDPSRTDDGLFIFKKDVDEVVLHATVMDDRRRFVNSLAKTDFHIFENGAPQEIRSFRREDVPVSVGIIIDNSGSMRDKRPAVNQAAINFVKSSNPEDQVFIVNFNDEYYLDQDFTAKVSALKEALDRIESRGGTAMYDAVVASAEHMKKSSRLEKRVLLVITDGEDNASRESLEQAVRKLQEENGPTIYTIGILGEQRAKRARRALQVLAEQSGGISFFPKDISEVDTITQQVAHDIRNQYVLIYKSSIPKNVEGYRTVKVEARASGFKRLQVRTRTGYYPGQERASN